MATAYVTEFADLAVTFGKNVQAPATPAIAEQTAITTSVDSAQSAAFNVDTRIIAISTPAAQAVGVAFGSNPTATANSMRLPANGVFFFGVKPGHKVALIDVS